MTNKNLYKESWLLYKTHSDFFDYDFDYYFEFSKGKKTLEAFAGYGRLANILHSKGVEIHANELSADLAEFITLPKTNIHIGDFLEFDSSKKFERIIIAYNSFCLITDEDKARDMFSKIQSILEPGGKVSLSYYHPNYWPDTNIYEFDYKNDKVKYHSNFDFSERSNKKAIWEDIYEFQGNTFRHEYIVRVYEDKQDLEKLISHTRLQIIDEIRNYNDKRISEEGWTEYVLQLR